MLPAKFQKMIAVRLTGVELMAKEYTRASIRFEVLMMVLSLLAVLVLGLLNVLHVFKSEKYFLLSSMSAGVFWGLSSFREEFGGWVCGSPVFTVPYYLLYVVYFITVEPVVLLVRWLRSLG